mgnify:CR=1 FL=1
MALPPLATFTCHVTAVSGLTCATLARSYRDHKDYLLDLRRLSVLHQRRANRLYRFEYWQDPEAGTDESPESLSAEIERSKSRIRESLRIPPDTRVGGIPEIIEVLVVIRVIFFQILFDFLIFVAGARSGDGRMPHA